MSSNYYTVKRINSSRNFARHFHLEPYIITCCILPYDRTTRYFVLELCIGTLNDKMEGNYTGPIPSEENCLVHMARGLAYIHSKSLAHRDISPDNILISLDCNRLLISDFGLCKEVSFRGTYTLTSHSGKNIWKAPELITATADVRGTISSDIFALGCVYFAFLTNGYHPFGGKFEYETQHNIVNGDAPNLRGTCCNEGDSTFFVSLFVFLFIGLFFNFLIE